jgi:hypothetical protein
MRRQGNTHRAQRSTQCDWRTWTPPPATWCLTWMASSASPLSRRRVRQRPLNRKRSPSLVSASTHSQQAVHLLAVFGPSGSAGRRLALHSLGAPVDVDGHSAPGIWLWPAPSGTQPGEPQVLFLEGTYGSEPGSHAEAQARAGPTQCVFAGGGCAPEPPGHTPLWHLTATELHVLFRTHRRRLCWHQSQPSWCT